MKDRKEGYYWVKKRETSEWDCAKWNGSAWSIADSMTTPDSELHEINETRIPEPGEKENNEVCRNDAAVYMGAGKENFWDKYLKSIESLSESDKSTLTNEERERYDRLMEEQRKQRRLEADGFGLTDLEEACINLLNDSFPDALDEQERAIKYELESRGIYSKYYYANPK